MIATRKPRYYVRTLLPAMAVFLSAPGLGRAADTQPAQTLEEIVVTAERREAPLQTTPVTVTALSEDALQTRQIANVLDIAPQVPNLRIDPVTGVSNAAQIFLRGVGEDQSGPNTDSAVGMYVDDVFYPRTLGVLFDFLDVERVEVLRGPQGTLHGRNTPGGAIKITTRGASEEFRATGDITIGNYDRRQIRASFSGPLSETLGGAFSLLRNERDGTVYSTTLERDVNSKDIKALRGSFVYTPSDALRVRLNYDWLDDDTESYVPVSILGGVPDDLLVTAGNEEPDAELSNKGLSLNWTYEFEAFELQSITAYRDLRQTAFLENDGQAVRILAFEFDADQDQFSQEFLLTRSTDRFRLLGGLYYFAEDNTYDTTTFIFTNAQPGAFSQETRSLGVFGNVEWAWTDDLTFSVGARWTEDDKESIEVYPVQGLRFENDKTWNAFTPRVTLDYRVRDNVMLFASYAEGYKAGGFNRSTNPVVAQTPFDEENVSTYELGVKSDLLDRRLRVNATWFYSDYEDLQLSAFDPDTNISRRFNAAQATTQGVELEISAVPFPGLQTYLTAGYLDAGYDEFFDIVDGVLTDVSSRKLKGAPEWSGAAGISYLFPETSIGTFRISTDVSYRSEIFQNVANTPEVMTPSTTLWNAAVSWSSPDQHWTATLGGKNLGDEQYFAAALFIANLAEAIYPSEPRTWTFNVRYDF